jgi:single-stranded DNA-binding protein
MNCVSLTGVLASDPKPMDTETPSCHARLCVTELGKDGQTYRVYVPFEAWGAAAITISPLAAGTPIAISGKLKWKSWEKDGRKQGSIVVSTVAVEVLHEASVAS